MNFIQNLNIVKTTLTIISLVFGFLIFFNFWVDFKRDEIFLVTNGFGVFFFSAPLYYLFVKGYFGKHNLKKDLHILTKKYIFSFENFLFLSSAVFFILIESGLDILLAISIVEQYLLLTYLSFMIFVYVDSAKNSLLISSFIIFWHFLNFNFLNSFPISLSIWLNPFSSWSYISWFKNDYLWIVLLLVKWTLIIWIEKRQTKAITLE